MSSRTLADLPIDLPMFASVKRGGAPLGSFKKQLGATWRRSIRSRGGFWIATASWDGEPYEMLQVFMEGLVGEVQERLGGMVTWQGFLAEMRLTLDGLDYVRSWNGMSNSVQAIYTRLGDNTLLNGSGETGVWAGFNTPTTLEQSAVWVSDGTVSIHIVSNGINDGAYVDLAQTVTAGKVYELKLDTKIVSGTWRLTMYRTDTSATLGAVEESVAGQSVLRATIPDSNTYTGAIGILLFTTTASGEIYADGGTFHTAGAQARTSWADNTLSQAEYGIVANALLLGGMSDDAANAAVTTALAQQAFPRTVPPGSFTLNQTLGDNRLELTFYGYAFTLRNLYTAYGGTSLAASTHVTNLIGECEFVDAGTIETNAMIYQIDDRAPIRVWEILRDITLVGSAAGARWNCGVYEDRLFNYQAAETVARAHFRGGHYMAEGGGEMEPWLVKPGLVVLDDMPLGPGDASGNDADDPGVQFIEQVDWNAAEWLAGESGLSFQAEASD